MSEQEPGPVFGRDPSTRVAFLLSQVGSMAASQFADRLADLGLQPSDIGILRLILLNPGMSQQDLASKLGVVPSRVVSLVDGLESKGLVERRRSTRDRRNQELHLTEYGGQIMGRMRDIGSAHERHVVQALSEDERLVLGELLAKVAASHGLAADVHPGYRAAPPSSP
ncbi:MarR family transcriptional regulator [Nocardioides marmoriginsengisoli]|uniref:MarR family transcriptional regulator n=1 Tax=Nocardioides marmoriginsengisoli TaxID=661483 RepID=A0A3N0CGK0_9ACTN|nr:MarR family winged helix-turn-helix transcriptional regulator [Nocardioides marmoriginsengisoli]RNL62592.1 MarR family transcriptional regulator [Nocardioides marmoriginsengisoli]